MTEVITGQTNTLELVRFLTEHHAPTFKFAGDCRNPQFATKLGIWSRCRKCQPCLEKKKEQWISRSVEERAKWPRAWFITLTYADPTEYTYENIQYFLKRLRERYKDRIAYIVTDEYDSKRERNYNPHHHLVLYATKELSYRDFDHLWKYGHSKKNLLENRSASYVAKYITKTGCRVRASTNYGRHTTTHCKIKLNPSLKKASTQN